MNIVLVDDHKIFREGVVGFLLQEPFSTEVKGFSSVQEAKNFIEKHPPEILITDLSLPESSGQELLQWVGKNNPEIQSLVMTMHAEISVLEEVVQLGAKGFITKSSGYDELVEAILRVSKGGFFLDQLMLKTVFQRLGEGSPGSAENSYTAPPLSRATDGRPHALEALTRREQEIFFHLIQGKKLEQISSELFISLKTVENHRSNLYQKLGVYDRLSLFNFAREQGFID